MNESLQAAFLKLPLPALLVGAGDLQRMQATVAQCCRSVFAIEQLGRLQDTSTPESCVRMLQCSILCVQLVCMVTNPY